MIVSCSWSLLTLCISNLITPCAPAPLVLYLCCGSLNSPVICKNLTEMRQYPPCVAPQSCREQFLLLCVTASLHIHIKIISTLSTTIFLRILKVTCWVFSLVLTKFLSSKNLPLIQAIYHTNFPFSCAVVFHWDFPRWFLFCYFLACVANYSNPSVLYIWPPCFSCLFSI